MSGYYMRNPAFAAFSHLDSYVFVRHRLPPFHVSPPDVAAFSATMEALALPTSADVAGQLMAQDAIQRLVQEQVLLYDTRDSLLALLPKIAPSDRPCRRVLFCVCGAIGALYTPVLVAELASVFAEKVDVILTEAAQRMVSAQSLEYLGATVWTDQFLVKGEVNVPHIYLAAEADVVVVWPTSAHTLHKLAHGACSDLLSLTLAATTATVILIPAMNPRMWSNAAVCRNVKQLREDGYYIVEPSIGLEVSNRKAPEWQYGGAGLGRVGLTTLLKAIVEYESAKSETVVVS